MKQLAQRPAATSAAAATLTTTTATIGAALSLNWPLMICQHAVSSARNWPKQHTRAKPQRMRTNIAHTQRTTQQTENAAVSSVFVKATINYKPYKVNL